MQCTCTVHSAKLVCSVVSLVTMRDHSFQPLIGSTAGSTASTALSLIRHFHLGYALIRHSHPNYRNDHHVHHIPSNSRRLDIGNQFATRDCGSDSVIVSLLVSTLYCPWLELCPWHYAHCSHCSLNLPSLITTDRIAFHFLSRSAILTLQGSLCRMTHSGLSAARLGSCGRLDGSQPSKGRCN